MNECCRFAVLRQSIKGEINVVRPAVITQSHEFCARNPSKAVNYCRVFLVARTCISRKLGFHIVGVGIGELATASMGSLRASIALPVVSAPRVARKESLSVVVPQAGENGGFSTAKRGPLIAEIPLEYIRRPLLRTRNNDPEKVKELMESIAEIGLQEPELIGNRNHNAGLKKLY